MTNYGREVNGPFDHTWRCRFTRRRSKSAETAHATVMTYPPTRASPSLERGRRQTSAQGRGKGHRRA